MIPQLFFFIKRERRIKRKRTQMKRNVPNKKRKSPKREDIHLKNIVFAFVSKTKNDHQEKGKQRRIIQCLTLPNSLMIICNLYNIINNQLELVCTFDQILIVSSFGRTLVPYNPRKINLNTKIDPHKHLQRKDIFSQFKRIEKIMNSTMFYSLVVCYKRRVFFLESNKKKPQSFNNKLNYFVICDFLT